MHHLNIRMWRWAARTGFADKRMIAAFIAQVEAREDLDALISGYEMILAAEPSNRLAMVELARLRLSAGDLVGAEAAYAELNRLTGDPPIVLYRTALMDAARASRGELYVGRFDDVLLETHQCALLKGDSIFWRDVSGRNIANHPNVEATTPDLTIVAANFPPPTYTIEKSAVLLGTDGHNYSHWLSRNVLKLFLLDAYGIPESLPILINRDRASYQDEYLDLLGIASRRLIGVPPEPVILCRELFVPAILRGHPRMRQAIDWLRTRVKHLLASPEAATERIYVSRKDSFQRILLNEVEVESSLAKLGFRIVTLAGMPVREQISLFSKARCIVSPHGAGLTNLMFAPPGASVVEITNSKISHMGDFKSIAFHMQQRYSDVVSAWYPESQPDAVAGEQQKFDYLVNVDDVLAAVDEALA